MLLGAMPGMGELILIFGVCILLFGGKKLPELGSALGESIKNFKKGIGEDEKKPTTTTLVNHETAAQIPAAAPTSTVSATTSEGQTVASEPIVPK